MAHDLEKKEEGQFSVMSSDSDPPGHSQGSGKKEKRPEMQIYTPPRPNTNRKPPSATSSISSAAEDSVAGVRQSGSAPAGASNNSNTSIDNKRGTANNRMAQDVQSQPSIRKAPSKIVQQGQPAGPGGNIGPPRRIKESTDQGWQRGTNRGYRGGSRQPGSFMEDNQFRGGQRGGGGGRRGRGSGQGGRTENVLNTENAERDGLGLWQKNTSLHQSNTNWDTTEGEKPASPSPSITSTASSVRSSRNKKKKRKGRGGRTQGDERDIPPREDRRRGGQLGERDLPPREERKRSEDQMKQGTKEKGAKGSTVDRQSPQLAPSHASTSGADVSSSTSTAEWEGVGKTFQARAPISKGEEENWKKYVGGASASAAPLSFGGETPPVATSSDWSFEDLISKHGSQRLDWSQEVEEEYVRTQMETEKRSTSECDEFKARGGEGLLPTPRDEVGEVGGAGERFYQSDYGGTRGRGTVARTTYRSDYGGTRGRGIAKPARGISSSYFPAGVPPPTDPRNFQQREESKRTGRGGGSSLRGAARHSQPQAELPPRFQRLREQQTGRIHAEEQREPPRGTPTGIIYLPQGMYIDERQLMYERDRTNSEVLKERIEHQIIPRINQLSAHLGHLLDTGRQRGILDLQYLHELRLSLQTEYKEFLPLDLERTFKDNLESRMWKDAFYGPIEAFRWIEHSFYGMDTAEGMETARVLQQLLNQSTEFYDSLLKEWGERFGFQLSDELYQIQLQAPRRTPELLEEKQAEFPSLRAAGGVDVQSRPPGNYGMVLDEELRMCLIVKSRPSLSRNRKLALSSCSRFLLAVGDVERYKVLEARTMMFGEARRWYMKSAQLGPTNGRTYNQLGLLGMYTHRYLDAVYYYIRSLAAKHKFPTAQQSLQEAFENVHRKIRQLEEELKVQVADMKDREARDRGGRRRRPVSMRGGYSGSYRAEGGMEDDRGELSQRREVWIGGRTEKGDGEEEDGWRKKEWRTENDMVMEILLGYSTSEMYKIMLLYFLEAVSVLVLKIGMETFEEKAEKALRLLQELLKSKSENPLTPTELVKLATISFYAYHVANETDSSEQGTCTQRLQYAVQLILSLWGVLMEQVKDRLVIPSHFEKADRIPMELQKVLPAARLMSMWISTPANHEVYRGIPSLDGLDLEQFRTDVWLTLAFICNKLMYISGQYPILMDYQTGPKPGYPLELMLPEEWLTTSFFDFIASKPNIYYWRESSDLTTSAFILRLTGILQAGEFCHGRDLRHFRYDIQQERFIALALLEDSPSRSPTVPRRRLVPSDDESEVQMVQSSEPFVDIGNMSAEFQKLHMQRMGEMEKQAALSREAQNQGLVLEITPTYLVPDTNGFIDYLGKIRDIVRSERYTVAVPVVVLNELRGLTRSDQEWVGEQSRAALEFLHECMQKQETQRSKRVIQAVTTQGSLMQSLSYLTEELTDSKERNDDKILTSCVNMIGEDTKNSAIRDLRNEPVKLQRKVVLLTGDRALRIKALGLNVPVKSVPSFAEWAGVVKK